MADADADSAFVIVVLSLDGVWSKLQQHPPFPSDDNARTWLEEQLTEDTLSDEECDYYVARKLSLAEFKGKCNV